MAIFTAYTTGVLSTNSPDLILGYGANLNQIFLITRGSGNNFFSKWNTVTHVFDVNQVATTSNFPNSLRPSQWNVDEDGQIYGGSGTSALKYDSNVTLLHTVTNVWPVFEQTYYTRLHTVGGTRYMYGLSDTRVAGLNATGTGLSFIGKANFGVSINSTSHFGIVVDSSDRVWAFGCNSISANGNATLLMIDPAGGVSGITFFYNTTTTYTVSGAIYGQPEAMFYSAADNSLVFLTATGFLVKVSVSAPTVITAALDINALVSDERRAQCASRFNPDSKGNIWLAGSDNQTVHLFNLASLTLISSFNVTTFGGSGWSSSAFGFLPDARYLVSGRDNPPFSDNFFDFLFQVPPHKRAIILATS